MTVINKRPNYIFIRLIIFFISLITLPQILIFYLGEINLISGINNWGIFSINVFEVTESKIVSFILSSIGLLLFFASQNIFSLIKIPKVRLDNLFKKNDVPKSSFHKKEPVINNSLSNKNNLDINDSNEFQNNEKDQEYFSPSLDILESNNRSSKEKVDNNIESNSELLENVFSDFNIDIKVINVKLGPVVTLFEILPAAGIKINTIINLADDISRSMGVGTVRIAQIYGTQFWESRYRTTIAKLLLLKNC